METISTNVGEYSVTELSQSLKRTVEDRFGYVRVRGEITGYRGPHASGHAYFALKDEKARLEAVVWRGVFSRLAFKPEEGLEVIASGKITTYPGSSKYQIVIDSLEPAGVGALMALLEERKKKLTAEGLFDERRKQLLPYLPQSIGVVTSPTGAVIKDILHRLADRFPVNVLVWPVRVQGEGSGAEVANAVRGFNTLGEDFRTPDVLIVARGGGSLEDLWSFNDEAVVRAVADSDIPVISAVGHETDWTLIDLAADVRAPTPTGAAEMAVPVRHELMSMVASHSERLSISLTKFLTIKRRDTQAIYRVMPSLEDLIAQHRQRFDIVSVRLIRFWAQRIAHERNRFLRTATRLSPIGLSTAISRSSEKLDVFASRSRTAFTRLIERNSERLPTLSARLERSFVALTQRGAALLKPLLQRVEPVYRGGLEKKRKDLSALSSLLQSVSYDRVLARGYAIVRDQEGVPIVAAGGAKNGTMIDLQFCDGHLGAIVSEREKKPKNVQKKSAIKSNDNDQGDLF